MGPMTDTALAQLHTRLSTPLAVAAMLHEGKLLEEDAQYALHDALSDVEPDEALLSIALSCRHIAAKFSTRIPVATGLAFESRRTVEEYGPAWLDMKGEGDIAAQALTLRHVPEDLEALADLLDSLRAGMAYEDGPAAMLCDILSLQARAHMEVAEFVLGEIDREDEETAALDCWAEDNVIFFPSTLRI